MSDRKTRSGTDDSESEVWNAIAAFEKILEAMPDDRSSLETLFHAYEHIGDRVRALERLLRLADVILNDQDADSASLILPALEAYARDTPSVGERRKRLQALAAKAENAQGKQDTDGRPDASPEAATEPSPPRPVKFRVADELNFAWKLFEAGEISQEEYAAVAQDLAELSIDGHLSTVSVLHALEGRAFSGMERVMGFISRETKTPIISLQFFEPQPEANALLPREFMIRRGALVFDLLRDDALVAVMNPYDRALRGEIENLTRRTCHYFMTLPREFDAAVAQTGG